MCSSDLFLSRNPGTDVRLVLSDQNVPLIEDGIDVALRIGDLPDSSLQVVKVGSVRRILCASPAYLEANGEPRSPEDLAAHAVVAFAGPALTSWTFRGKGGRREQTVSVRPRLSVNTAEAALDAAIAGVGITRVLSYQAADAVARGKLKIMLSSFEPPASPVNLVHPAQSQLPRRTRAFLDLATGLLRKRLALIA